jgi:hypothetical protein
MVEGNGDGVLENIDRRHQDTNYTENQEQQYSPGIWKCSV